MPSGSRPVDSESLSTPSVVTATWKMNTLCNFRCPYCFLPLSHRVHPRKTGNFRAVEDVQKIIRAFDATGYRFLICMTGGEPLLYPGVVELCCGLTQRHRIELNTNLTTKNVLAFAEAIDPGRVEGVRCSLHVVERERLGLTTDLVEKVKYLRARGFNVYVTEVLWPPMLDRLNIIADSLLLHDIVVWPVLFRGTYRGRVYPASYNSRERALIEAYIKKIERFDSSRLLAGYAESDLGRTFIGGLVSFKGRCCRAGLRSVYIDPEGEVWRCPDDRVHLGNIFHGTFSLLTKATPCRADVCGCPWIGFVDALGPPNILTAQNMGAGVRLKLGFKAGIKKLIDTRIGDRILSPLLHRFR